MSSMMSLSSTALNVGGGGAITAATAVSAYTGFSFPAVLAYTVIGVPIVVTSLWKLFHGERAGVLEQRMYVKLGYGPSAITDGGKSKRKALLPPSRSSLEIEE